MLLVIGVLSFITVFVTIYLLLHLLVPARGRVQMRLKALEQVAAGRSDIDEELGRPFGQRVVLPLIAGLAELLARFTPMAIRKLAEEKMSMAGGLGRLGPNEFLLLCGFLSVCVPAVVCLVLGLAGVPSQRIAGLGMISFALAAAWPFLLLSRKIAARKASIQRDLPDVLDLLTVSVEAGLGFDGALAKLAEKMSGALVEEFNRVLQEIRVGVPRRQALAGMGLRCDVADVSLFTTSLIQADQLGVSIGSVLRVQSAGIRQKRRQRAQETAMKAPIKLMFPLVLFIFPTLFVVLLGPALIQIIGTLMAK